MIPCSAPLAALAGVALVAAADGVQTIDGLNNDWDDTAHNLYPGFFAEVWCGFRGATGGGNGCWVGWRGLGGGFFFF